MSTFYGDVYDVTPDSATLYAYFKSDTPGFTGTRYVILTLNNGWGTKRNIAGINVSSTETEWEYDISGLSSKTTYTWEIQLGYKGQGDSKPTYLEVYDSGSFTTEPPKIQRPSNFSWAYTKTAGESFNLTATEWNNFTSRINEFREYRKYSAYSFTKAYQGDIFTAAMYNQARKAIQDISGHGTYIPTVSSGDTITAYSMNILVSELNAIP